MIIENNEGIRTINIRLQVQLQQRPKKRENIYRRPSGAIQSLLADLKVAASAVRCERR
jgi:hypothetical protein